MINKQQLRVGFIGCGRIADLHRLGYINNPRAKITAVCIRDKAKLKKISHGWKIDKTYTDYKDLLNDPDIDLVEILTPHDSHFKIATDAARAGKHISLQKVPVMTLKEYDDLLKVVKQNKIKFRVFENFRFHKPYQRALELVSGGKMGKVKTVNQRMWVSYKMTKEWPISLKTMAWRMQEGVNYRSPTLFDDGFHKHSIAQMFLPPITGVRVWCNKAKFKGLVSLDVPSIVIYETNQKDTYGSWNVSTHPNLPIKSNYYSCDEFVEITLEKGIILIYGCTGDMFNRGVEWMDVKGEWHSEKIKNSDWKYSFISSTNNFIDTILLNKKASLDEQEARDVLKITLAIVKSFKKGGIRIGTNDREVARVS